MTRTRSENIYRAASESSRNPNGHAVSSLSSRDLAAGATAQSPWAMPKRAWIQVVKRCWVMVGFHEVGLLAAGVAFFIFLALSPLMAATVMVYGLVGDVATVRSQMRTIVELVPQEAAKLIEEQLMAVVTTSSGVTGFALVIALFFAVYGGMRAVTGLVGALNIINEEHEKRNFFTLTLRAAYLTLAAIGIALTGLISGGVFAWLQLQTSVIFGPFTDALFKVVTWLAAIALGSTGFAMIMRYGPCRRPAKWRWLIPGALLSTLLWIAVSFGFSLYVAYISDYNATYGSLSAIVVFLMWLFLSAYGVLIGALLNAEIERQTIVDTTAGPDMPPGERGAALADMVDTGVPTEQELIERRRGSAEEVCKEQLEQPAG